MPRRERAASVFSLAGGFEAAAVHGVTNDLAADVLHLSSLGVGLDRAKDFCEFTELEL